MPRIAFPTLLPALASAGLLVALALGPFANPARATVESQPVRVRITGPRPVAESGLPLRAMLELSVKKTAVIENLRIEGDGWSGRLVPAGPAGFAVTDAAPSRLEVECTPSRASAPLVIAYEVDGRTYRQQFDLSPEGAAARRGRPVREVPRTAPNGLPVPPGLERMPTPGPDEPATFEARAERAAGRLDLATPEATQMVFANGTIVYTREDGVQIGADGVTIELWDWHEPNHRLIGTAVTDRWGNFSVGGAFADPADPYPDLFVSFRSANAYVHVASDGDDAPYRWTTAPVMNFTGGSLKLEGLTPIDEGTHAALHILTDLMRDRRWYEANDITTMPFITARWPVNHGDVSHYHSEVNEIHLRADTGWNEHTHAHEYGHHFMHHLSISIEPQYCNEPLRCDPAYPDDCGHCGWCQENAFVQWSEGVPNWLGGLQAESYEASYGVKATVWWRTFEVLETCPDPVNGGFFDDPLQTEGFASAVLRDIGDANNEDDFNGGAAGQDELALGPVPILDILVGNKPALLMSFLDNFVLEHPEVRERLWATTLNNSIDLDSQAPGNAHELRCASHVVGIGVPSTNSVITYEWSPADDDWSGPGGYSVTMTNSPAPPPTTQNIPDTTRFTTAWLEPGNWYFNIRAVDRAGRWSTTYNSIGPVLIGEKTLADLEPALAAGWGNRLVPRAGDDATYLSVSAPLGSLPGNTPSTFWNACGRNAGQTHVTMPTWNRLYLDGERVDSTAFLTVPAGSYTYALNRGPLQVRGGRHTLAVMHDGGGDFLESDEDDNLFGRQWIWSPHLLSTGATASRPAPPHPQGGWSQITTGATPYFDCDGLRIDIDNGTTYWHAAAVRPDSAIGSMALGLHVATVTADTGFGAPRAWSKRGPGRTNAVLVHRRKVGTTALWDVSVVRDNDSRSGFQARQIESSAIHLGDSLVAIIASGKDLRLYDFVPASTDTGYLTIHARLTRGSAPVYVAWYERDFQLGALTDHDDVVVLDDSTDTEMLDVHVVGSGARGIAVWRDMVDGDATLNVELKFERTRPDLQPYAASSFYAPLVPSPAPISGTNPTPVPGSLTGNMATTYLNYGVRNGSPAAVTQVANYHVAVDGVPVMSSQSGSMPAYAQTILHLTQPVTVRGGRHSLTIHWDARDLVLERWEDNNVFGEQWVWSPLTLGRSTPVTRSAPPERTGGWDEVTSAPFGYYYNCDGLRTPAVEPQTEDDYWLAMAVMPGDTSDVDVRLHPVDYTTQQGFRANYGASSWGIGRSDFCLVNFRVTPPRRFDAGVLGISGSQSYTAEAVFSTYLASAPAGDYGAFSLPAGRIVNLHEVKLPPGTWDISLLPKDNSGAVDWGLAVHPPGQAFLTKSDVVMNGAKWTNGPGLPEAVRVLVPSDSNYCVSVWKAGRADVALDGIYVLRFVRSLLGAPHTTPPMRTSLGPAYPNPTGASSRLAFELARPAHVSVEVYDLRGARVRTLCDREMPAGRHEVAWDGTDGRGRGVPPGVYLVRFAGDGVAAVRRLVRLE